MFKQKREERTLKTVFGTIKNNQESKYKHSAYDIFE